MMIDVETFRQGWSLLDSRERRQALFVLTVIILAGLSAALMVGSIVPFLTVLSDPTRIETSRTLSWLYETGGFESDYGFLLALGFASLCMIIVANLVMLARVYVVSRFTMMRVHSLSCKLLTAYLSQDYEYYLGQNSGEMGTQILAETQQVILQFFAPVADAISSVITALAIVVVLLAFEPGITFAALLTFGVTYGTLLALTRRYVGELGRRRAVANKARFRAAGEALGGIKAVKLSGREAPFIDRYARPSLVMSRSMMLARLFTELPQYLLQVLTFGGMIILCLVLLSPEALQSGGIVAEIVPTLGLFAFAAQRLLPELSRLYRSVTKLQFSRAAVNAVHKDLAAAGAHWLPQKARRDRLRVTRDLVLENVRYTYPGAESPGLVGIDLKMCAGERIGIVGGTGAGKSTFADILLGLLRPNEGRLLADGIEITEENLRAWRSTVAYVPQQIFLTDGTVAENIAFGVHPDRIDRRKVEEVARIAQIHDHIVGSMPEGYDTMVGDRGVRLSGGQCQRIGIARALYEAADLIVFDEATSALDNVTERELIAAIEGLPGDRTVVMIAHRLSTVRRCDRILLFDKGRIVASGSWDSLSRESAAFRALAASSEAA
ncbi:MAG: ABC transporter ATP-binding protein [Paracoccaceae bacterium]|nr:ABC transporter ATP-binding protein [Paracoccaceae bacterium]